MIALGIILTTLIRLYLIILAGRIIIDLVSYVAKDWVPRGFLLVVINLIFAISEPPLALVRKIIPHMSFGGISIALEVIVVYMGLQLLDWVISLLMF
ncbi:YggT family protein [Actinotignum urinale]|uniref:YggT family protein n=1 Tax=Actinotignum urinale TaxID=190146 RepID=UPI002A7EBC34|nr:YggT family protein [Actinotignum urinale]MDY5151413.1 YggT family protein [Actinotignum urinale]